MIRIRALLVALTLCSSIGTAFAQDPDEPMKTAAKALYNEAREARKTEDFATCYAKASAAWAIHKHASIAALVGDCAVGVAKYRDAAIKLRFFFDAPKKIGSDDLRKYLASQLEEAKKHIAIVKVSVSVANAACDVDGERIEAPLPAIVFLDPGSHAFEARHADYETRTRQVTVSAGTTLTLVLELDPKPAPVVGPDPGSTDPGMGYIIGASVSGAVGLGGLALGIASVILHGSASDDIDRLDAEIDGQAGNNGCVGGGGSLSAQCGELQGAIDDQSTFATLFPVGIIIGGVGAAAAATFLVLHFTAGSGTTETEATVSVSPNGFSVQGRF